MGTLFRMIPAIIAMCVIGWFVAFQFNPYKFCEDHPDPAKHDKYYVCEPFGFELQKGTFLDRSTDHRFAGEDKVIYSEKKKSKLLKNYNCEDANVLLTQDGYDYCMSKTRESK